MLRRKSPDHINLMIDKNGTIIGSSIVSDTKQSQQELENVLEDLKKVKKATRQNTL